MRFDLFQEVAITQDIPDHNLKAGDVATIIEFVSHPAGGEDGCVLEVFSAVGKSVAVVVVPLGAVEPLTADEVLAVRPLVPTA